MQGTAEKVDPSDLPDGERCPYCGRAAALLCSIKQAMTLLDQSQANIYKLIGAGELRKCHVGRSLKIYVPSIHEYVDRLLAAEESRVATTGFASNPEGAGRRCR